jgi:hypothetical protein
MRLLHFAAALLCQLVSVPVDEGSGRLFSPHLPRLMPCREQAPAVRHPGRHEQPRITGT